MNASALARYEGFELQRLEAFPAFVWLLESARLGCGSLVAGEPPLSTYAFFSHWCWGQRWTKGKRGVWSRRAFAL